MMKRALTFLLTALVALTALPAAASAASPTFTLMLYLCGTDLESEGGMATLDLRELMDSGVPEGGDVTVYIQTGGTKKWATDGMSNKKAERWTLSEEGLTRVDSVGSADMGSVDTFSDFLRFGYENFPADRYGLVLWDHGGGVPGGVCVDELTENSLNMGDLYSALSENKADSADRRLAFVGFDACLMANYEMAMHLAPFADYMIASEETEPGEGWAYSSWVPALVDDPTVEVPALGKLMVDGFLQSVGSEDFATLSVVDLNALSALSQSVEAMADALTGQLDGGNFASLSRARQNVRSFGETDGAASDMIDLLVFAQLYRQYDASEADALLSALEQAVVYNGYTANLSDISGLSILVPSSTRSYFSEYLPSYDTQSLMPAYTRFISSFADQLGTGSYTFGSTSVQQQDITGATVDWFSQYADDQDSYYSAFDNLWGSSDTSSDDFSMDSFLGSLFGSDDVSASGGSDLWGSLDSSDGSDGSGWWSGDSSGAVTSSGFADLWSGMDEDSAVSITGSDGETYSVENPFANASSDYAYTVTLSETDLTNLATVEACLMMDVSDPDFECYVDLGYVQDTVVDWSNGKVYGTFNGSWPTLDGQMVCMYDQIANENYCRSLIPVTLNGKEMYLLVVFTQENPYGEVVGATDVYSDPAHPNRGSVQLKEGDVIIPQYELLYWDENDEMQSEPFEGEPITVGADGTVEFGYYAVEEDADYLYGFCLNDVYGDYQYTDFITLSF